MTQIVQGAPASVVLSTNDKLLIASFAMFVNEGLLRDVFGFAFAMVGIPGSPIAAAIVVYLPLLFVLVNRMQARERLGIAGFAITLIFLATLFVLSFVTHPEYAAVMFDEEWPFNIWRRVFGPLSAVWAVLFILMMRRAGVIFAGLRVASYVTFVYCAAQFLLAARRGYWLGTSVTGEGVQQSYSLEFGYQMLVPVVFFTLSAIRGQHRVLHSVIAVIGFGMILAGGNRAPAAISLVALVVFAFIVLWHRLRTSPLALFVLLASTGVLGMAILNAESIIRFAGTILNALGLSSRSIDAALSGAFNDDNGRAAIYAFAEALIREGGFFGYGLYGDRFHLVGRYWWGYPHSLLLELQITFGVVLGGAVLVLLAAFVLGAFIRTGSFEYRMLIAFFGIQCLQLAVSLSYLYNPWFWALLATAWLATRKPELRRRRQSAAGRTYERRSFPPSSLKA